MEAYQAWQATLGQLQMNMSKATFDTWVRDAKFLSHDEEVFYIGVQNAYVRDWLENRLTGTVTKLLSSIMNTQQKVIFQLQNSVESLPSHENIQTSPTSVETPARTNNQLLNHRYRFDNFVVGPNNRMAHAASLAVAENPSHAYNPLFLYGGVGLGKTHLLQAIGNHIREKGQNVLYVSSEEFTNDLINAIRVHNTEEFRKKYRFIDVLLIDDIQFIAGKESTQEEFFHTFNTLHSQNKQIVLSSDRPPKAMTTLEERLRSRFEWGLTVDVQPPELETRIAILRAKAESADKSVPYEILEYIAQKIQWNIRELEGALTKVLAYSELSGRPLTLELTSSALLDFFPDENPVAPDRIIHTVAKAFNISKDDLLGRTRTKDVALPRQVAMYLMREESDASLPQIGTSLGGRDHTTVMYACDKIADMIERDDRFRRQVFQIRDKLHAEQAIF
ncbi:MAG: chromosomal replication initiator protein DnaA [Anaerolineaceae bacterium]|jgi:chromosomal replication initiator protein|nr:MAG: chromosomal replication initiator protein DnaA [Anaerolineaceae bacterium]